MAADDVWRCRREAGDERGYYPGDDNRTSAWAPWGTTGRNSAHRGDDGLRPSGGVRPPQKGRHGAGDLPKPVHFVSAAVSSSPSPSDEHGDSRDLASSSLDPPRHAVSPPPPPEPEPEPGSLASNAVVAQMMRRMNYKAGTGLGRHGQGIVAPIEVALRPKNAGLGSDKGPIVIGGPDELPPPPPSDENWPKWDAAAAGGGARKRKRDREFDDEIVLARRLEESAAEAVARVQKALARAARWSSTSRGLPGGDETMPAAAAITKAMERVQEQSASGTLTTGELIREFAALKERFPREYAAYRLADTARAIAAPLLRAAAFRRWESLEDPSRGLEAVTALKGVLLDNDDYDDDASPYAALVDDVVVRPALASAAEAWEARKPEPMVRFLETWGDALPLPAIQRVLERAVMPKLSAAVASWEPRWEPVPCHVWVQPWAPLLGRRWLEPLYATVRRKLGEALVGWHAARALGDHDMVVPWKDAFGAEAWEVFVARHVVPYLRHGLRSLSLRVAPPRPDDGGFAGVVRWAASSSSVVSAQDMARLLEEEFFGRWQHALRRWLWAAKPTAGEAMAWHEGWKRLLTPELLAEERVSVHVEAGLQMINRAAQGLEISGRERERGQHAGEAHSCRSRSRWPAVVGSRSNKRRY